MARGWVTRQNLVYANNPSPLQVLSIDSDTYPDLAVTQTDSSTGETSLRVFTGGVSGFGAEQTLENDVPFTSFTRLADLNGDGLLDVASFNTLFVRAAPGNAFQRQIGIGAGRAPLCSVPGGRSAGGGS